MKKIIISLTNYLKTLYNKDTNTTNDVVLESPIKEGEKYKNIKILIDNGHGKNTNGKRSPYSANSVEPPIDFMEYLWNREISDRVVNELFKFGYNVSKLTPEDIDISLTERVSRVNKICSEYGKENVILISIHSNSAGDGSKWMSAKGWSVYTSKGQTNSDKLAECLYDEAEKNFPDRKIRVDNQDGDKDWEENFYICQKTKCIAVLTENFFYDNVDDVNYILSDEGKLAVVKTHVDGIRKYIKDTF